MTGTQKESNGWGPSIFRRELADSFREGIVNVVVSKIILFSSLIPIRGNDPI